MYRHNCGDVCDQAWLAGRLSLFVEGSYTSAHEVLGLAHDAARKARASQYVSPSTIPSGVKAVVKVREAKARLTTCGLLNPTRAAVVSFAIVSFPLRRFDPIVKNAAKKISLQHDREISVRKDPP